MVMIENIGDIIVQLIGCYWEIVDVCGSVQQVNGLVVVGYQLLLVLGQKFQYSFWVQIDMFQGSMKGCFFCVIEEVEIFYIEVFEFLLVDSVSLY